MTTLSFDYEIESFNDLMKRARKQNLWFYAKHEDSWYSPDELEAKRNDGRCLWDAPTWQLRKPDEKIAELQKQIGWLKTQVESFKKRMND